MSGKPPEAWSYEFRRAIVDLKPRAFAQFTCIECSDTLDVTYVGHKPPEFFMSKARQAGWTVHETRTTKNRCGACANGVPMQKPGPIALVPPSTRKLNADERLQVRGLLDKHFDDGAGEYLDEMSDAKLGEMIGVPWALVATIREAAYGPIRVDPELTALSKRMAAMEASLAELKNAMADYRLKQTAA